MTKDTRTMQVRIHPAEGGQEREYVASYGSEYLKAEYTVRFPDTIFGALALHEFCEMVRKQFGKNYRSGEVEFVLEGGLQAFENMALRDVMSARSVFSS